MREVSSVLENSESKLYLLLDRVMNFTYKIINLICKVFLFLQVVVVSYVVFSRYILKTTPSWGEEIGIFCMVWFALLSIAIGIKNRAHVKVTLTDCIFPEKLNDILDKIVELLIFVVAIIFIIWGGQVTEIAKNSILPGMGISNSWLYLSLPSAGVAMFLMNLGNMLKIRWAE